MSRPQANVSRLVEKFPIDEIRGSEMLEGRLLEL